MHTNAKLLTDDEVRDYRAFLIGVKGYKAATVNAYLAPLRAIVRDQGRTLKVKGVRQTRPLIETLDGRDLGRLINVLDGPDWQDKRDVALINVLARAGLRVSEALALRVGDVEINARSGALLVRHGKGMKERPVPLSAEARAALSAYLKVRPRAAQDDTLFLSRTCGPLDPRDAQRIVAEAGRIAGVKVRVTPHALRHYFHLAAVEAFLAQLLAQAGEPGLPGEIERDAREFQGLVADVLHGGTPFTVEEMQDLSDFLHDLTLALPYLPEDDPRLGLAQAGADEPSTGSQDADRFAQHVGMTVLASALAAGMDEALLDGQYAMALSSHEPSFSPGAPVSPFDPGGPAFIGV